MKNIKQYLTIQYILHPIIFMILLPEKQWLLAAIQNKQFLVLEEKQKQSSLTETINVYEQRMQSIKQDQENK
jgi:hypothetical protein